MESVTDFGGERTKFPITRRGARAILDFNAFFDKVASETPATFAGIRHARLREAAWRDAIWTMMTRLKRF